MDAFVTRKRKRNPTTPENDKECTEFKLAILSSLHASADQDTLLDVLLAHDGSVEAASAALRVGKPAENKKTTARTGAIGAQTSLRLFVAPTTSDAPSRQPKKTRLLSRKGTTLHLFDPQDVERHTACSLKLDFLPAAQADALLREMLDEAKTFGKNTFKLFDRVVQSPHTSSFYVGSAAEMDAQTHEYVYNGARLTDVRRLTPELERVRPLVEEAVNGEVQHRMRTRYPGGRKLRYQCPLAWRANAAFVNCYDGPAESVGWHADSPTYVGPRAVIGSLSVGVAREFRVRRVLPKEDDDDGHDQDEEGQISIHLPHNSLLVMHAEMQEEWKHCVAPALAIDPHPVAGRRRINITYRNYREPFHPRHTPRCKCRVPCVLRVVQRKRENWGRYFWACHAGNVPGKEGCAFFRWAEFDHDGNPIFEGPGQVK